MTKRKDPKDFKPRGAKKQYNAEIPKWAARYAKLGINEETLALWLEINVSTLRRWKKEYPDLKAAIDTSRKELDAKVAGSVYRRAIGFKYTEVEEKISETGKKAVKTTTKYMPGDVSAALHILKNRYVDHWGVKEAITKVELRIPDVDFSKLNNNPLLASEEYEAIMKGQR